MKDPKEIMPTSTAAEPPAAPKRDRSIGEKAFDWFTYGGVAGVGTFIATIPLAFWMRYQGGAKHYDAARNWLKDRKIEGTVNDALLGTFITMWGGNAMMLPVAGLEKAKVPIVKAVNRLMNDPTDPTTIEEVPKQTIGSLIWGRIAAFSVVFVSFFSMESVFKNTFKTFNEEFGELTCKVLKKPTHVPHATELGKMVESTPYRVGKIAALDVFATVAAATLLYISSHFLAKKEHVKRQAAPVSDKRTSRALFNEEGEQHDTAQPASESPSLTISHARHDAPLNERSTPELQAALS